MLSQHTELAKQYYTGQFDYGKQFENTVDPVTFALRNSNFYKNYDDFYHPYFKQYGQDLDPLIAIVQSVHTAFQETYAHMPKCYNPCAISSGTNAHLDAVTYNHHTSDKLSNVIPSDKHVWQNIKDNSYRSLARAHKIHELAPDMYMVTPSAFEGSTRVFSHGSGRKLTGGLVFDGGDYMAFWNMVMDSCEAFILDDITKDMPTIEQVREEIKLAQSHAQTPRDRSPIYTTDWNNSRNSILEMARGTYIQFGLHPLRPDAKMELRLYDEDTHTLHKATLLERTKPVIQNILRWVPQGIAAEEAVRTAARLLNLHKMRIDPKFNAQQDVPLNLGALDSIVANPSLQETQEFNRLIEQIEPFLLQYCAHLMRPEGLPEHYTKAHAGMPIKLKHRGTDIINGNEVMKWQRKNVPLEAVEKLWPLTQPKPYAPETVLEKRSALHGQFKPQRRKHNYESGPFTRTYKNEIWPDHPYEKLDEMSQDQARIIAGALETGILPLDTPDFHGVRFDTKRGMPAIAQMNAHKVQDISLLPGALGKTFQSKVGTPNLQKANEITRRLSTQNINGKTVPTSVFGTPQIKAINNTLKTLRPKFVGPGPSSPNSDFRLALEMEMLRRNYTDITFQKGWETSEDCARMMIMATKIEFGKVERPAGNDTEMKVLDEDGKYISFFDRYEKLRLELDRLSNDPELIKHVGSRNAEAIEKMGVRHISLALARIIEIYDCLIDQQYNQGRFELQHVENQSDFTRDLHKIQNTKFKTKQTLFNKWAWLWDEDDLNGMHDDYHNAWHKINGMEKQLAGPAPTDDQAIKYGYTS